MTNLIRRFAIPAAFLFAFAAMILAVGNTLAVIQSRQMHQTQAIDCLLDSRCSAVVHGHGLTHLPARQPNPVAPATTLV